MPMTFQGPPAPKNKWKEPAPWVALLGVVCMAAAFCAGGNLTKAVATGGCALVCTVSIWLMRHG